MVGEGDDGISCDYYYETLRGENIWIRKWIDYYL